MRWRTLKQKAKLICISSNKYALDVVPKVLNSNSYILSETHTYRNTYPITLWGQKKPMKSIIYSTVAFAWCKGVEESADVIFHFSITYRRPPFSVPQYSQYQFFLYETITAHREKGKTFDQIAEWLNKKGYLSVRGKKFKGNHIHSIVKKKRLKDEKLEREYPVVWSDFSLEVVDKTLVNMFEGL